MLRKFYITGLILVFFSCQTSQKKTDAVEKAQEILVQTRQDLLPDKRDQIFDIKMIAQNGNLILKGTTDAGFLKDSILSRLQKQNLKIIDSIRLLPLPQFQHKVGVTRLSVANLRANPKHSAELVTQTLMGMPLQVYEEINGFYHVKTPEAYYAWIDKAGMVLMSEQEFKQWLAAPKIIITGHCGTIRQEKYTDALPVSDYVLNDVFILNKLDEPFAHISYPDGREGYLNMEDFTLLDEFAGTNTHYLSPYDIVHYAKEYLGIPYLWGGTSIKGVDCSGFTKNVYAQAGYLLPRDASQQVKIGKEIPITNDFSTLKTGDLLFFGRQKNGKEKITHVAIHLGNGKIIHATGEVKIESLNKKDADYNPDRRNTLLQARRIYKEYPQNFAHLYQLH